MYVDINNLLDEEILKLIFIESEKYYTKLEIINSLLDYNLSNDRIQSCLNTLDYSSLFTNIDLYYEKKFIKKKIKKMPDYEIVRCIVRNTEKDSEFGNFHNVEYHYIGGMVINELKRIALSNLIIENCSDYLNSNPNELYKSDRYIINVKKNNFKTKVIYNKVCYKLKNIYIVYNESDVYYCIRTLIDREKEIDFIGKKYYRDINYDYYDLKTNEVICDSKNLKYHIISLDSIFSNSNVETCSAISLNTLDVYIREYLGERNKVKTRT